MGKKEVTWWSGEYSTSNYVYDFERYLDIADIAADDILRTSRLNYTNHVVHPMIFGDGTPSTMIRTNHWMHTTEAEDRNETVLLTAKFLHQLHPSAKLLIMLRNPVDVTFSAYKYFDLLKTDHQLKSVEHFHLCVLIAIETILDCQTTSSIFYCTVTQYRKLRVNDGDIGCNLLLEYLQIGRYYEFIHEWFKFFPRQQFIIINFEDYIQDPASYVINVWKWIGVTNLQKWMLRSINNMYAINSGNMDIGSMMPKTRQLLHDYFKYQNQMLAILLHDNNFLWEV